MAFTAFDTHKFVRRLEQAGMPTEQAEVQVEVLTEAFTVNFESLVNKEFMDSRLAEQGAHFDALFAEQEAKIEKRFAEQDARFEKRFAEQDAHIEKRFAEQDAHIEKRFAEQDARFEKQFLQQAVRFAELEAKMDSHHRLFVWTQAIITAAVVIPYLERMMAL
jgi:hypothetical protein